MRGVWVTIGLVVFLATVTPRFGSAAEPNEDDANGAALAGRYQEALDVYAKLYSKTREPTYLHNIARCHQKMGHPDEAIDYFNRYLREAHDLEESVKLEVRGYIREMEALRESRRRERSGAVSSPSTDRTPSPVFVPVAGSVRPVPTPTPTVRPATIKAPAFMPAQAPGMRPAGAKDPEESAVNGKETTGLRTAAIVAALVGVAATGVGAYYGIRSRTLENQASNAKMFSAATDSEGETAKTRQYVMYGVGALCLAVGAALYYVNLVTVTTPAKVSLRPSMGPTFVGGLVEARF